MDKKMDLSVAGKTVTLNFGVNWFIKFLYERTGIDVVKADELKFDAGHIYDGIAGFAFAGYQAECKVRKQDESLTYAEFYDHVMGMDPASSGKLFNDMVNVFSGSAKDETPGETEAQGLPGQN